jgi:cell division protein FtsI/penicillin-binding protein 2
VWVPAAFFGLFALVVAWRLVQVQILDHPLYAERARNELQSATTLFARRGSILDRNGSVLAVSISSWDIYVNARAWRDAARAEPASEDLAEMLQADPQFARADAARLRQEVAKSEMVDVPVARQVEYEAGRELLAAGIPGVIALPNTSRINPEGDTGASVLGFVGLENTGLAGIERWYNDVLQGQPGRAVYERDTTGEPIPFGQHIASDPIRGKDLVLTIDRYIQQLSEQTLAEAMRTHRARGGAIIVMDPYTGELLALATSPGLKYSTLDLSDEGQEALLRNRAVTDLYEPGSVMKVVTAAAAIDQGVVTPDTTYVDNGVAYSYGIPIRNWDYHVYGLQSMTGVLRHSINTGAVFMVEKLGQEVFHRYLDAFGFGAPTGIDLDGEAGGIIRRPSDSDWSPVDLATQSFGQSISVTPIQMISAVATAINGGVVVRPHLVAAFVDPDGSREEVQPEVVRRALSQETSDKVRHMLHQVVGTPGTFHPGKPKLYSAGGKSGTANVPIPNGYDESQVASFVGFSPAEHPRILVMVKLDENQDFLTGTQAGGPIFAKLADQVLQYLDVAPDDAPRVSR